jgi:hypothetical protein
MTPQRIDRPGGGKPFVVRFEFTPAQWHNLLNSPAFLDSDGNRSCAPRMLLGCPVSIVPPSERTDTAARPGMN